MQENLARGLSVVSRAVSTRSTLPVLANVLLKTEDGGLKLTATNLEIGITYWVPGKIDTDGSTTVPAKLLTDYVNTLQGGEKVDLELTAGETLHLRSGRYESHLKGIDADEFPSIQTAGERPTTRIAQNVLRRALEETTFAAASDEARPILTGVLARFEGDTVTLAAADNYRIAVKTIPILDAVTDTSVVIPARALNELTRVLADVDDPVEVVLAQAKNQILFHLEGVDLVSRLIDGQFPNYQRSAQSHATRAVLTARSLSAPSVAASSPRVRQHRQCPAGGDEAASWCANAGSATRRPRRSGGRRRHPDWLHRPLPGRRPERDASRWRSS
jgi:DNA polymerase-3 subunit beta